MIDGLSVPDALRIPVVIQGTWLPGPARRWEGSACSHLPIVALTFLRSEGAVQWCRNSQRSNTIEVSLALFAYDESGTDVQVNAGIGGGYRIWRSVLPSTSYRPMLKDNWPTETGHVTVLSTVAGNPRVDFLGLFLAASDVRFERNRIWHAKESLRTGAPELLQNCLSHGRTGVFLDDVSNVHHLGASP